MMLIKTQLWASEHAPWQGRQSCTEHGNAPEISSFSHFFLSDTARSHAIDGHVTGGTYFYLISAGDCVLNHLRAFLILSWTCYQNTAVNVSYLPDLLISKTLRRSEFYKSLTASKVSAMVCIILWKQFLECCD